jgi:hypothetical protein
MTNYPLANVWFDEAVALVNAFGKRWNMSIYFEEDRWYVGGRERGAYDIAYPSFSLALKAFLVIYEQRLIEYTKPYEYKD